MMPSAAGHRPGLLVTSLFRYGVVGGVAALTEWAVYALFLYTLGFNYLVAALVAFVVATAVNYVLSLRFVFRGGRHRRLKEATLVYVVSTIGLGINLSVLYICVAQLGMHEMISKIIGTGFAFLWNFSARHVWVFHPPRCQ
jgi:putative flippase GtrA